MTLMINIPSRDLVRLDITNAERLAYTDVRFLGGKLVELINYSGGVHWN